MKRRTFLKASSAGLLATGLPLGLSSRIAHAASGSQRKFIFVFNAGGYDPTRVFATEFGTDVDMEPDAELNGQGDLSWVSHLERPSVDTFMSAYADRVLVMNGLLVRSISHDICTMISMTGTSSGTDPDWPAVLASAERERFILPHLVLGGPSFPGELGVAVARTGSNGQLEGLLSGEALVWSDTAVGSPSRPAQGVMDRYLMRRALAYEQGARSGIEGALATGYQQSLDQAQRLKDLQYVMDLTGGGTLADQAGLAVDALSMGVSRCITLQYAGAGTGWDTHADNDAIQSPMWESLFSGLDQLCAMLARTPGEVQDSLLDETTVVVLSEMGRTPQLNVFNGKDHWPYTSVMLVGGGFTGGRVVGGFDEGYYGLNIDPASGEVDEGGQILSAESLGATLLAMADVDPGPFVMGVDPIEGVLA